MCVQEKRPYLVGGGGVFSMDGKMLLVHAGAFMLISFTERRGKRDPREQQEAAAPRLSFMT